MKKNQFKNISVLGKKVGLNFNLQNKRTIRNLSTSDEFEKELNEIKELEKRRIEKRDEMNKIDSEAQTLSNKFIEKYSEYKPIIGEYSSYVDKSLTAKQLLFILSVEKDRFISRHELKKRIKGWVHEGEIIDPIVDKNVKLMEEYGKYLDKVELIEGVQNSWAQCNMLLQDRYLIKDKLENFLSIAWDVKSPRLINPTDKEGFYMVVFNVLNSKNKRTLVYNAVKYNYVFLECFLIYVLIEQMSLATYNSTQASDFYFCVDTKLNCFDSSLLESIQKHYDMKTENVLHLLNTTLKPLNPIEALKIEHRWQPPFISIDDMSEILVYIFLKRKEDLLNKLNICCKIEDKKDDKLRSMYIQRINYKAKYKEIFNLMSKFVFIVSDLDLLLNNLKKVGFADVNAGPQKFRGNPSYLSFINTTLDQDFRNSLWLHNIRWAYASKRQPIPRGLFSFKNIHMNLGSVRWYSQVSP